MLEDDEKFYVQIVNAETGEAVKTYGPTYERRAEKIERGIEINLNHERFYTDLISHGFLNDRPRSSDHEMSA